ncbi:MAG: hypothetical protein ACREIO_01270, partial [Nitrospiraceae bacterium]
MEIITDPLFWTAVLVLGVVLLVGVSFKQKALLNNVYVAVTISLLIAVAYFHLVDHYLMDMQGLDYWYLFR